MVLEDAIKKLDTESEKYKLGGILEEWKDQIVDMASTDDAIRDGIESHSIAEVIGKALKYGFDNKIQIHDDIVKAAGMKPDKSRPIYIGVPTRAKIKKIIKEVYTS